MSSLINIRKMGSKRHLSIYSAERLYISKITYNYSLINSHNSLIIISHMSDTDIVLKSTLL